mgnify:CR=1 FL=1
MVKKLAGVVALALCLSAPIQAATNPVVIATPPQPTWTALSQEQQAILAPLAPMENYRRKKWLGIAQRYKSMSPAEQQRLQEKMQDWARLTPQQRLEAREKYKEFSQMAPEEKAAVKQKWQDYKQLPEDEKQRLREQPGNSAPATPLTPTSSTDQR